MRVTFAHGGSHGRPIAPGEAWQHWWPDLAVMAGLVIAAALYATVYAQARRRSHRRALGRRHAAAFSIGIVAVALATASPLEPLSSTLLVFHMAQHVLLVTVAAPLIAYGAPLARLTPGLPAGARRSVGRAGARLRGRRAGVVAGGLLVLHTAVLWTFHLPAIYERALTAPVLHALEHLVFLGTGTLLWAAVLGFGTRTRPSAAAVGALFGLGAQGAALGALMTFAAMPWYPSYASGAAVWELGALVDQQLAGLLMWGAGGLAPVAVAAALLVGWLGRLERYPATVAPAPRSR